MLARDAAQRQVPSCRLPIVGTKATRLKVPSTSESSAAV
jgi:hypothetical protein